MSLLAALSAEKARKVQSSETSPTAGSIASASPSSHCGQSGPKKIQSVLKSSVQSFGKHILSFQHDESEMHKLLHRLVHNIDVIDSIERTKLNASSNLFFEKFDEGITDRVIGQIIKECEGLLSQLRSFLRTLGDVTIAMKFTAQNVYNDVVDLNPKQFSGTVFNEDHMLSVQE